MKYLKTANTYKASNVVFNAKTIQAFSYDWWQFVKVLNGKVVFNNYRYSVSTAGHQRKVRKVMRDLGIKIDAYVYYKPGLQVNGWVMDCIKVMREQVTSFESDIAKCKRPSRKKDRLAFIITDLKSNLAKFEEIIGYSSITVKTPNYNNEHFKRLLNEVAR